MAQAMLREGVRNARRLLTGPRALDGPLAPGEAVGAAEDVVVADGPVGVLASPEVSERLFPEVHPASDSAATTVAVTARPMRLTGAPSTDTAHPRLRKGVRLLIQTDQGLLDEDQIPQPPQDKWFRPTQEEAVSA